MLRILGVLPRFAARARPTLVYRFLSKSSHPSFSISPCAQKPDAEDQLSQKLQPGDPSSILWEQAAREDVESDSSLNEPIPANVSRSELFRRIERLKQECIELRTDSLKMQHQLEYVTEGYLRYAFRYNLRGLLEHGLSMYERYIMDWPPNRASHKPRPGQAILDHISSQAEFLQVVDTVLADRGDIDAEDIKEAISSLHEAITSKRYLGNYREQPVIRTGSETSGYLSPAGAYAIVSLFTYLQNQNVFPVRWTRQVYENNWEERIDADRKRREREQLWDPDARDVKRDFYDEYP